MSVRYHNPVLLHEIITYLNVEKGGAVVDATLGGGGHSKKILEKYSEVTLIGIDQDADALDEAWKNLSQFKERIILMQRNFSEIKNILKEQRIEAVNGILLDLGVSSYQIDTATRGFSFDREGPLDMRMNSHATKTAAHIVNRWRQEDLVKIFKDFGEEPNAKKIARSIVRERDVKEITTTMELKNIIKSICGSHDIKPVARIFQALRIAVNRELDMLKVFLHDAISCLRVGGRFLCISYHSLEDRIVKNFMKDNARDCICPPHFPVCMCDATPSIKVITRKPIVPSEEEIEINSRARSAKLRVCERIA